MENFEVKLNDLLKDYNEIDMQISMLLYAKFNNTLKDVYSEKMSLIENSIDNKIKSYGKEVNAYASNKKEILDEYTNVFQTIFNVRKTEFSSILLEIQEIQANQKIAVLNFYKFIKDRKKYLKTNQYSEFLKMKKEIQKRIDNTLNHVEFNKYTKMLDNMKDPLEVFVNKINAISEKFNEYELLRQECLSRCLECIKISKSDFDSLVDLSNTSIAKINNNKLSMIFQKILSKFVGDKKIKKEVFDSLKDDLSNIEKLNIDSIKQIDQETIDIITGIEKIRSYINTEFDKIMKA